MARKSTVLEPETEIQNTAPADWSSFPNMVEDTTQLPATPGTPPAPMPQAGPPPPKYLGKTPTSIAQIIPSLGEKGTHFKGPLLSGGVPGANLALGSALLSIGLQVDYTMGSFSLPLQFPADCFLLWKTTLVYNAFTGGSADTTVTLGTGSGRNDILAADGMGPLHAVSIKPVTGPLPFTIDPNPGQLWVTVTSNGNTAGLGVVVLIYARGFQKWS